MHPLFLAFSSFPHKKLIRLVVGCHKTKQTGIHGSTSWKYNVLKFLHKPAVEIFLACLLMLDVIILITEMSLLTFYPPCHFVERDAISCCPILDDVHAADDTARRWLAETSDGHGGGEKHDYCGDGLEATDYEASCDDHKWSTVHTAEDVLFGLTMAILVIFFVELNVSLAALGPCQFFRHTFFLMDYIVVTVSIVMEATFKAVDDEALQSAFGLLILFRLWRFVRIGHGIIEVTHEMGHEREEKLLIYIEELEEIVKNSGGTIPEGLRPIEEAPGDLLEKIEHTRRQQHRLKLHKSLTPEAAETGT
jgi:hypothetical protein